MANWVITTAERYISLVYDRMKEELIKSPVIHADETPVMVTKDGREGMHKNFMWVYRSGSLCKANQTVLRLMKLPPAERKKRRKSLVKPLVDAFFDWCRNSINRIPPSSETADGIKYCLNQEKYLRVFLDDPQIPLDNNLAEQAIRPFCVGKKNWKLIDTVHGAQASAILYSIVETAKANELNIYQYFKHLLTEIPRHMDDTGLNFLDSLLPWSKQLPEECRKKKKTKSG